jgi:hypothetical protein
MQVNRDITLSKPPYDNWLPEAAQHGCEIAERLKPSLGFWESQAVP